MFYKFLSSPDALQGDECLNMVHVTAISLDAKFQLCKLNIHIDDSNNNATMDHRNDRSKILAILLRNERRFRRYLSQHMKFRAVPSIEFIFERSLLDQN